MTGGTPICGNPRLISAQKIHGKRPFSQGVSLHRRSAHALCQSHFKRVDLLRQLLRGIWFGYLLGLGNTVLQILVFRRFQKPKSERMGLTTSRDSHRALGIQVWPNQQVSCWIVFKHFNFSLARYKPEWNWSSKASSRTNWGITLYIPH